MTQMHGGNITRLATAAGKPAGEILDFSANINPLGPPEWLRPLISAQVSSLVHYPDPDCTELVRAFAERFAIPAEEVIMGNGETELLHLLPRVLGKGRAVIPVPSYSDYAAAAELAGLAVEPILLPEELGFALDFVEIERKLTGGEIVILGRPNNPTGALFPADALRELAAADPRRSSSSTRPSPTSPARRVSSWASDRPISSSSGRLPSSTRSRASAWAPPSPSGNHPAAPRPRAPLVGQHPRSSRGRGSPPR